MNEVCFELAVQLDKKRIFFVDYHVLGWSSEPYFSTSAAVFNQPKTDYTECGQCQDRVLTGKAREFWKKWDQYHLKKLEPEKLDELMQDIQGLKEEYNYLYKSEKLKEDRYIGRNVPSPIVYWEIRTLSKQEPKKKR